MIAVVQEQVSAAALIQGRAEQVGRTAQAQALALLKSLRHNPAGAAPGGQMLVHFAGGQGLGREQRGGRAPRSCLALAPLRGRRPAAWSG